MFFTNRVVFIHAPRTGGTWLTRWAAANLPHVSICLHWGKHDTLGEFLARYPEASGLAAFTVLRDEEERFASWVRLCRGWVPDEPPTHTPQWAEVVRACRGDLEAFRRDHFAPMGRFLPGATAFPFEPGLGRCVDWLRRVHGLEDGVFRKEKEDFFPLLSPVF